ncbi:ATP-binding protein [Nonomuraea sp. NPDC049714]|uniref:ATP-binding protein n=1 Tax=Nonomuraea sp. NPDC049714 TaxID=3364357 RepID=UPI0037AEC7C3
MSDPSATGRGGAGVPFAAGRLVGRERDVAELRALIRDERVITLIGPGGIGKTRLAAQVAGLERANVVELGRVGDPALIVRLVAEALDVHPAADGLLVLDGCDHLREGCAELVAELAVRCPGLRFLLTGRRPVQVPGELVWRVPPLALPGDGRPDADSVALFVDRAAAAGAREVADRLGDVERLCRLLEGVPLALELAAAHAGSIPPARMLQRVGGRHGVLRARDPAVPGRARAVWAVLEWSHELLSPKERVLLRRLPVFAGAFDLELAGRVCADGGLVRGAEVPGLLRGLADKALVVRLADGRHRLHGVVKEYAAERSREAAEEVWLRDRHLRAVCEAFEHCHQAGSLVRRQPWPERAAHVGRGRSLLDECRAAIGWAVESGGVVLGLRLACAALATLRGDPAESAGWLERLLELDLAPVPDELAAVAKGGLAYGLRARGELGRATRLAVESVEEQRRHPYTPWLGLTYAVAMTLCLRAGRGELGRRYLWELELAASAHEDLLALATARLARLDLALSEGRLELARRLGEEALALAREAGHHWALARALTRLGAVAEAAGDPQEARDHHAMARPLLRVLGEPAERGRRE